MEHLSIKDIHDRLSELEGWEMIGHEITKEFHFNDFKEAMEFVHKAGEEAERIKHFPDIIIRNNRLDSFFNYLKVRFCITKIIYSLI